MNECNQTLLHNEDFHILLEMNLKKENFNQWFLRYDYYYYYYYYDFFIIYYSVDCSVLPSNFRKIYW